jgi:hypothetical protein
MKKQFTIEDFRTKKHDRVETRDGNRVFIYDTDLRPADCGNKYTIAGKIVRKDGSTLVQTWQTNGQSSELEVNSDDLFLVYWR